MFNRFKGLIALFSLVCVFAIIGGSAYFYFGEAEEKEHTIENKNEDSSKDNNVFADNILENYEFGVEKDLNEEYTYIFFPSTLYTELYTDTQNPEDFFGYNEVILDDGGDPAMTADNQPQYNIVKKGSTTYYDYMVNNLNNKQNYYLYSSPIQFDYPSPQNTQSEINSNHHTHYFGDGLDGDDYAYFGYDLGITDPYSINNKDAFKFFINNYDVDEEYEAYNYGNSGNRRPNISWVQYDYALKDQNLSFSFEDEVLSPIYNDSDFDISLNLNKELDVTGYTKNDLYYIFTNLYQKGSSATLTKAMLENTNINYNYGEYEILHDDFNRTFDTFSLVTNLGNLRVGNSNFVTYNRDKPYIGAWTNSGDNMRHILILLDGNIGYFAYYDRVEVNRSDYKTLRFKYSAKTDEVTNKTTITFNDGSGENKIDGSVTLSIGDYSSQIVNRAQYRNDRFGFWTSFYDWDDPNNKNQYNESLHYANRYLPIKITVNGNLTPDDMSKVVPSVSASTFDNHMWFDFTANIWSYAKSSSDLEYNNALSGFTAKDISNIFDIMQHPSKYADEHNVIRLFPVFSNGKNYGATKPSEGGSDGIQASFKYKSTETSIENNLLPSSTKLTYSTNQFSESNLYGSNNSINYAVLKNVELVKGRYDTIEFKITTTITNAGRGDKWTSAYSFSGDAIDDFIDIYGEGLYTFYLFIGNRATNNQWVRNEAFGTTNSGQDFLSSIIKMENDSSGNPNILSNKHLMPFYEANGKIVTSGTDGFKFLVGEQNDDNTRPIALTVEKVTNLRLVTDIPITEEADGTPSNNQDWSQIDSNVEAGLINAQNFILANDIYEINEDQYNNDGLTGGNLSGTTIDSSNPYIYLIQNADFRFVNNLYFQIRFSNQYIKNGMTVKTDYADVSDQDETPEYLAYKIDNENIIKFKFQNSGDKDVFIDNTNPISGNLNGQTVERQGFKLRDYNARGVYDILLVSTNDSASNQQTFNMYINRHTNSFIKLFNGNPGTFEFTSTGSTEQQKGNSFVRHKLPSEDSTNSQVRNDTSTLLWNGQTYLGEYLTSKSVGTRYSRSENNDETPITDPNCDNSLFAAIQACCGVTPGTDTIYAIKDAVTGQVVAYYNSGVGRLFTSSGSVGDASDTSDPLDLFTIVKNYVLYIEKV